MFDHSLSAQASCLVERALLADLGMQRLMNNVA
jgi:hypothetical protein